MQTRNSSLPKGLVTITWVILGWIGGYLQAQVFASNTPPPTGPYRSVQETTPSKTTPTQAQTQTGVNMPGPNAAPPAWQVPPASPPPSQNPQWSAPPMYSGQSHWSAQDWANRRKAFEDHQRMRQQAMSPYPPQVPMPQAQAGETMTPPPWGPPPSGPRAQEPDWQARQNAFDETYRQQQEAMQRRMQQMQQRDQERWQQQQNAMQGREQQMWQRQQQAQQYTNPPALYENRQMPSPQWQTAPWQANPWMGAPGWGPPPATQFNTPGMRINPNAGPAYPPAPNYYGPPPGRYPPAWNNRGYAYPPY